MPAGAFLHLLLDALGFRGSGSFGAYHVFYRLDVVRPCDKCGVIAISIVILTWGLLRESLRLSIDAVP